MSLCGIEGELEFIRFKVKYISHEFERLKRGLFYLYMHTCFKDNFFPYRLLATGYFVRGQG